MSTTEIDKESLTEEQLAEVNQAEDEGFAEAFGEAPASDKAAATDDEADDTKAGDADTNQLQGEGDDNEAPAADEGDEAAGDEQNGKSEEDETAEAQAELEKLLGELPDLSKKQEMTQSQLRSLSGKIGEINRTLTRLQETATTPTQLKLSKESFKRLAVDFPEIAEQLAEDLSGITLPVKGEAGTTDVEALVEKRVNDALDAQAKALERRLLKSMHSDYETVTRSQDWVDWTKTLPQEEQVQLAESWDADYIGEKLTAFKAQRAEQETAKQQRTEKLKRAIGPKTTRPAAKAAALTEEDGFNLAFKS